LGVGDQLNVLDEVFFLLHVISLWGDGPKWMYTDRNHEHLMNWNNKFQILLRLFLSTSYGKV